MLSEQILIPLAEIVLKLITDGRALGICLMLEALGL